MYRPSSVRDEQYTERQVVGKTTLYLLCIWFQLVVVVPPASSSASLCAVAAAVATARSLRDALTPCSRIRYQTRFLSQLNCSPLVTSFFPSATSR